MTSQTYDTSLSADPQETGWGVLRTVLGKKDNSQEIQNPNNGVTSLARVITSQRPRPLTVGKKNCHVALRASFTLVSEDFEDP